MGEAKGGMEKKNENRKKMKKKGWQIRKGRGVKGSKGEWEKNRQITVYKVQVKKSLQ